MKPPDASSPHIFTLTGNLLAERTLEFERWSAGRTQRALGESFQVGGKGINVAKMLRRLGVPNTALCFTGGAPGAECEDWLRTRGFDWHAFTTQAPTRAGTVVRDHSGSQPETTFLGPDVPPGPPALSACAAFLDRQPGGQVLALCGSFPGWDGPAFDPLRDALDRWTERGGHLVVDSYGPPLAGLIRRPLALLKINRDELHSLGCAEISDVPRQVQQVVITDGPGTVHVREAGGAVETFTPPVVQEVSPTGSGDVLLACVLEAVFVRALRLRDAVAFAIPYAAANAAHPGIAEFPDPAPRS